MPANKTQLDLEAAARSATQHTGIQVDFQRAATPGGDASAQFVAARFRLPCNGLRIVLMPDFSAPVFAYQTWFSVGSADEPPGRTGLAHLCEHLMFKATHKHPAGALDAALECRGSETNAGTWLDWTYYAAALAARGDNLETVIDFESDRMTGLLLDEETFNSELDVVRNERRMAVDDSVSGFVSERLFALAFPEHPYGRPTIGSMQHLQAMQVDDVRSFYRRHYGPSRATVVLVGAVEPQRALVALARAYGAVSSATTAARGVLAPAALCDEPRHETLKRMLVAPQLAIGYRVPAQNDPDFPAVEMLIDVLTGGDTARLYRRLVVEEQLASEVAGAATPFASPGLLELTTTLLPAADPARAIAVIEDELNLLGARGVSDAERDKASHTLELASLDTLRDVQGRAEALGHYETNFGDFALALAAPLTYRRVTREQLQRVAQRIFIAHRRCSVAAVASQGAA